MDVRSSFLKTFPSNFEQFSEILEYGSLGNYYVYLHILECVSKDDANYTCTLLLSLGSEAYSGIDAQGDLQQMLVKFAISYPDLLIREFKNLNLDRQKNIASFLVADVENFDAYGEFYSLLGIVKNRRENHLYDLLISAKEAQLKQVEQDHQ